MFELQNQPRWTELTEARDQCTRRLDIYQQQYRTKEAQYAELGIVRKRNLEKVLRTLNRQETISKERKKNLMSNYSEFQKQAATIMRETTGEGGASYAQRSLHSIQRHYYDKIQRMMPAWEEHKTKLKLEKLATFQKKKLSLEEQRIRVSELSKYNSELDARLHQASQVVQHLEQQVREESSEQVERLRQQQARRSNEEESRRMLEEEVRHALSTEASSATAAASSMRREREHPVSEWTTKETCACMIVLRQLIESHPKEMNKNGYACKR